MGLSRNLRERTTSQQRTNGPSQNGLLFGGFTVFEVTGLKINCGAGYGLEIACTYHFYGVNSFIDKLKELVEALHICKKAIGIDLLSVIRSSGVSVLE